MNAFEVATPASMVAGSSAKRVVGVAAHGERESHIDGAVAVRGGAPLADARAQRPLRGRRRARARVVEREEGRRAAERGRHRVLEEPVRVRVGRDARVGVDVDRAGEDQEPGRIDHLGRTGRRPARSGSTASMTPPRTATSASREPRRRDDRPAADDEVGHSTSVIRIAWAPSQRQRRPTSRRRSSQPSSGTTEANTLAASWPTFDAVVAAAVREEDLALADPARVDRQGPRAPGATCGSRSRGPVGSRRTGSTSTRRSSGSGSASSRSAASAGWPRSSGERPRPSGR